MENPISNYLYRQWKVLVDEWINYQISRLKEEDYLLELSPGKNHGVFILGHLVACDDDFSVYMGKGNYLFPEYQEIFSAGSELQTVDKYPPVKEILEKWKAVCDKNEKIYKELTDAELKEYHAHCENPDKDFFKTKERIIQMWQVHQAYHVGQLGLLESIAKSKQ